MTDFKVGDTVRFIEEYNGIPAGTEATVLIVHSDALRVKLLDGVVDRWGRYKDIYAFSRRFENAEPPRKLAVGDYVRLLVKNSGLEPGTIARVTKLHADIGVGNGPAVSVDLLNGAKTPAGGRDKDLYFFESRFEKITLPNKADEAGYAPGDRVKVLDVSTAGGVHKHKLGTVLNSYSADYINVKLDDVDHDYYPFRVDELKADKPSELEKSKFSVGDKVTVVTNYGNLNGKVGTVKADNPDYENIFITVEFEGGEWLLKANELDFAPEPKPERVFQTGDWVEVHGRNDRWDGTIGQVQADGSWFADCYNEFFVAVKPTEGKVIYLLESKLRKTDAPVPFKEGDWVRVSGYGGSDAYDNIVGQFVRRDEMDGDWGRITQYPEGNVRRFPLENLVATDAPESEKTWVEKLPVGTFGVTKTYKGLVNRIFHKTGEDEWTVQYGRPQVISHPDRDRLNNPVRLRDNEAVESIVGYEEKLILI